MTEPILPGSTLGILGGGQLGRMLAAEARRMGYRVHVFSPSPDSPAGQLADREVSAPYQDERAVADFAAGVDVVTLEFENIPVAALEAAGTRAPVRPGMRALYTAQHRLREKTFLAGHGFPVAPFAAVRSAADLAPALAELGAPAVLKTAGFGYDGKGQAKVASLPEAEAALAALGGQEAVLEAFVPFERELSVVAARAADGTFVPFDVIENHHAHHILDLSVAPADVPAAVRADALEIARGILETLEVVGVLCVEFFLLPGGQLRVNELAPRPHNSGHLSIEACPTSQFGQQLRAVCGLPLGAADYLRPAAMANLLGDLWQDGVPRWARALELPGVTLHLYGKAEARPGRKMGHLTANAGTHEEAARLVLRARARLAP
ncbi:MAG TPA: 5-(carboxyamino)imidazole ribonucleotide synthase [Trueperaceae bacterium]